MSRLKREEHAISLDVWNARRDSGAPRYVRWEMDDIEPVREAYVDLTTKGTMTKIARQYGGYVITRHAALSGLDKIYAEIRPDEPVYVEQPEKHFHANMGVAIPPPPWECPNGPHIKGDGTYLDCKACVHPDSVLAGRPLREHIDRKDKSPTDHRGENPVGVHIHHDPAKYVFPPTPKVDKVWPHVHHKMDAGVLQGHLRKYHHELRDLENRHGHVTREKDDERSLARRLDVHPLAWSKLKTSAIVYFCIEGSVKNDAILSAGGAVFSVPSVGHWAANELDAFIAKYLPGKIVFVICDSDWNDKWQVMRQARLCQFYLKRRGISAFVAAPPPASDGDKQGVDDYLHAGGSLDQLHVIERQPPAGFVLYETRDDQIARNIDVFASLCMIANPDGTVYLPLATVAKVTNTNAMRVSRALKQLNGTVVRIDGAVDIGEVGWVGRRGRRRYSRKLEFVGRPLITIEEACRAQTLPPTELRDFLTKITKCYQ